jgi:uncharacterized membrane protein
MKKSIYPVILRFALAFTLISILDDALWFLNYNALNYTNPWERFVLPLIATICMELFYVNKTPKPNFAPEIGNPKSNRKSEFM